MKLIALEENDEQLVTFLEGAIDNFGSIHLYISDNEVPAFLSALQKWSVCEDNSNCDVAKKANHLLGLIYAHGSLRPADLETALYHLHYSVDDLGDTDAAAYLGWLYLEHPKIKDETRALAYLKRAIASSDPNVVMRAANFLGTFYIVSSEYHTLQARSNITLRLMK